jgi:hypothetical protein
MHQRGQGGTCSLSERSVGSLAGDQQSTTNWLQLALWT